MRLLLLPVVLALISADSSAPPLAADEPDLPQATVRQCDDFSVDGRGTAEAWSEADWIPLHRRPGGTHDYETRIKLLYSSTGLYVLFDGTDRRLTATMDADFEDLWHEDVYECFLWPDESHPLYFEYEISPLGYELPILVPNLDGRFLGWRPWHYEGDRRVRKAVSVTGGVAESLADVAGWRAEVMIPWKLLQPLTNVPPRSGTVWRANFYRVDYDHDQVTGWDWARVGPSFHDFRRFGTLRFE